MDEDDDLLLELLDDDEDAGSITEKMADARRKFRKLDNNSDAPSSIPVIAPKKQPSLTKPTKESNPRGIPSESEIVVERLSHLKVRSWRVSPTLVEDIVITGYSYQNLDTVLHMDNSVTVGVIVEKTLSRTTSTKQSKYMVWKVSDLNNRTISLFLFGEAYEAHWKEAVSTVVAIIGATSSQEGRLTVKQPSQLVALGLSPDFGICKATRKDGMPCSAYVNATVTSYCQYHVVQGYKAATKAATASKPKSLMAKIAVNAMFSNPLSVVNTNLVKSQKAVVTPLPSINALVIPTGYAYKSPTPNFQTPKIPTVSQITTNSSLPNTKSMIPKLQTSKDLATIPLKPSTSHEKPRVTPATHLSSSSAGGTSILSRPNTAMERAINIVKQQGGVQQPHTPLVVPKKTGQDLTFKEKFAAAFGKVDLESEEGKQLLTRESAHSDLQGAAEKAKEAKFDLLEQRDQMLENMQKIKEVAVKRVVHCPICDYTAESRSQFCVAQRHEIKSYTDVKKRFFKCKSCKWKAVALGRMMPTKPCTKCRSVEFTQISLAEFNGLLRENGTAAGSVNPEVFMPVLSVERDGRAHVERPDPVDWKWQDEVVLELQ